MPDVNLANMVNSLESVLRQLIGLHSELLELLKKKRDMVRASDPNAVAGLCMLEHEKLQKIAELEKRRLKLVADLTLRINPKARTPMCMMEIADRLGEPVRGRLLVARQQLQEQMQHVQQETHVVRRATETLARHMHGIVQTLGALSTGVSTYGSRGAFPQRNTAVSTFSATA